jgi:hypothetical protein
MAVQFLVGCRDGLGSGRGGVRVLARKAAVQASQHLFGGVCLSVPSSPSDPLVPFQWIVAGPGHFHGPLPPVLLDVLADPSGSFAELSSEIHGFLDGCLPGVRRAVPSCDVGLLPVSSGLRSLVPRVSHAASVVFVHLCMFWFLLGWSGRKL